MYRPRAGLVVTDLGQELVLLDSASGKMYSLNATGGLVWRHLHDLERARRALCEAYAIPPEQAQADVEKLLEHLLRQRLIEDA
ncbi:PqqD family protein [Calidithermus chliarophilus]|uniref:PqqD family protein n=1 Tax=Calidithermus chliarophilus TaxID=52023 RepID=UPI0003FCBE91|nr:PqqD family protein [Calidithermus chliarophilus]